MLSIKKYKENLQVRENYTHTRTEKNGQKTWIGILHKANKQNKMMWLVKYTSTTLWCSVLFLIHWKNVHLAKLVLDTMMMDRITYTLIVGELIDLQLKQFALFSYIDYSHVLWPRKPISRYLHEILLHLCINDRFRNIVSLMFTITTRLEATQMPINDPTFKE